MPIPPLSEEQLQDARAAAAQARRERAAVKAKVKAGELTVGDVLDLAARDDIIAHIRVVDLLKSVPRVGPKRAEVLMERFDIASGRRPRGLGRHQIAALKKEFS
ncbi:hypothetical protein SDC9_98042 [bioreactor metagenome]|uniref:Integration host factor-like helix-two turn-helix domain-containing protein n=1 Tax=bioreactor metagenome TaxID=1076179 RepID=A0A645ANW4_9ZZZZ